MDRKGILVVVSGFSGSGKGTLMKALVEKYHQYALSISATTRQPRPGEENGREYFFVTREAFQKMAEENALIEYAQYVDNYYGTPRAYVEQQLSEGRDVILEIEIQGARKVREQFPEAVLLFVTAKDLPTLRSRLTGRGTETPEVVAQRLRRAAQEAEGIEEYDYLVINDDLETCVEEIHRIIESEHRRISRNRDFICQIREELEEFSKGE